MRSRKRIRLAYACPCNGESAAGRPYHLESKASLMREAVHDWTGEAQSGCPWFALRDPFVERVLRAYAWFESGQIAVHAPRASHRLIEGVGYYHRTVGLCQSKQMEIDREAARKK